VLVVAHTGAEGSRAALAQVARAAFAEVPGLGRYLPRLGYRAALALAAAGGTGDLAPDVAAAVRPYLPPLAAPES
jgi:hypothetical protein